MIGQTVADLDRVHAALARWMWQHGAVYPEYHFLTCVPAGDIHVWAHGAYAPTAQPHTSN